MLNIHKSHKTSTSQRSILCPKMPKSLTICITIMVMTLTCASAASAKSEKPVPHEESPVAPEKVPQNNDTNLPGNPSIAKIGYETTLYQNKLVFQRLLHISTSLNSSKCKLTSDLAVQFQTLFDTSMNLLTQPIPPCNSTSSCASQWLPKMNSSECAVFQNAALIAETITTEIILLRENSLMDPIEYESQTNATISAIELLTEQLSKNILIEDTDAHSKFHSRSQLFIQFLHLEMVQIEQLRDLLLCREKSFGFIVYNIQLGKYDAALQDFLLMRNDSKLTFIIESAYQLVYFEQIATFISLLPTSNQRLLAIYALHRQMETHQHFTSVYTIVISKLARDEVTLLCLGQPLNCSAAPQDLVKLITTLEEHVKILIVQWAVLIQDGNYTHFMEQISPNIVSITGWSFQNLVSRVISSAYANNGTYFGPTLQFVTDLRWNIHKYTGFAQLISIASGTDNLLKVAYKMKHAMANLNGPDPIGNLLEQYNSLKISFPKTVHAMLWHSNCFIKSQYHNEAYLLASDDPAKFDGVNRRILVGKTPHQPYWKFEPVEQDGALRFNVRNTYYSNEYLGAHTTWANYNAERGYVSCRNTGEDPWKMEFLNGDRVMFWHVGRQRYMYSSDVVYGGFKYPFIWIPGTVNAANASVWHLECYDWIRLL